MTRDDIQLCMEYWEIPLLESYIVKLEDAFEKELSKHQIARDYINVLIRSYAHCMLVMKEIVCLVKNGYPDGALARARRIYEDMMIAQYLNSHKADADFPRVIERYFDDQNIRAYDGLRKYYRSMKQEDKEKEYNKKLNKIIKKYCASKNFNKKKEEILTCNYWWATNSAMSFSTLSKCLDDEFAKLLYLRACYSIHAGAMGDVALLGRPYENGTKLYSGATYNGFSTPLQLSVSSICNLSEIVFENFGVPSPIPYRDFISLLQVYFKNATDEAKEQADA